MKKIFFTLLVTIISFIHSFAQSTQPGVEMADKFRADGKIYVVVAVAGIILCGIFVYLIMLDRKISKLEKEIKE